MSTVADATRNIRGYLGNGRIDGASVAELRINDAVLDGLTPEQTSALIRTLTDDELAHWADEMHAGMLGRLFGADGLAHDQRRDLFNHLSAGLDSTQLERVYRALGPEDRQAELLDAIVTYASDATRAELVSRLASDTTDKPYDLSIGFGTIMTQRWDRDARAISCLIGSLRQVETIERSIASLDTPQLEAVLKAGTAHRTLAVIHVGSISRSQLFDTSGIEAVIDALGRGNDTAQKARVFELASRQIDAIRDTRRPLSRFPGAGDAAGSVAKALSDLVKSDTGAIVTALERGDGISSSRTGREAHRSLG